MPAQRHERQAVEGDNHARDKCCHGTHLIDPPPPINRTTRIAGSITTTRLPRALCDAASRRPQTFLREENWAGVLGRAYSGRRGARHIQSGTLDLTGQYISRYVATISLGYKAPVADRASSQDRSRRQGVKTRAHQPNRPECPSSSRKTRVLRGKPANQSLSR